jgi:hypothetical protein
MNVDLGQVASAVAPIMRSLDERGREEYWPVVKNHYHLSESQFTIVKGRVTEVLCNVQTPSISLPPPPPAEYRRNAPPPDEDMWKMSSFAGWLNEDGAPSYEKAKKYFHDPCCECPGHTADAESAGRSLQVTTFRSALALDAYLNVDQKDLISRYLAFFESRTGCSAHRVGSSLLPGACMVGVFGLLFLCIGGPTLGGPMIGAGVGFLLGGLGFGVLGGGLMCCACSRKAVWLQETEQKEREYAGNHSRRR